jgi:hypothetical protein
MPRHHIYNDPDPTGVLSNIPSDDAAGEFVERLIADIEKTSGLKPPADGRLTIGG